MPIKEESVINMLRELLKHLYVNTVHSSLSTDFLRFYGIAVSEILFPFDLQQFATKMLSRKNLKNVETIVRFRVSAVSVICLSPVSAEPQLGGSIYCTFTALHRKPLIINGAGEGNRTLVSALGRPHSTIEPHPRSPDGFLL